MTTMPKRKSKALSAMVEEKRGKRGPPDADANCRNTGRVVSDERSAIEGSARSKDADSLVNPVSQSVPGPSCSGEITHLDKGDSTNLINLYFNLGSHNDLPSELPSVHSALGLNVNESTRAKITSGLYVDLSSILESNTFTEGNDSKLAVSHTGELVLKPFTSKRQINDIESWTDAILIYSSIYLSAHPDKIQDMLKYIHTIRTAASRHGSTGWKNYDQQFRLRLARDPLSLSYGKIDYELWLMFMNASSGTTSRNNDFIKNKCYDFNYKVCTRVVCPYQHACLHCGFNHPSRFCQRSGKATFQNVVPGQPPRFRPRFRPGQSGPRFSK